MGVNFRDKSTGWGSYSVSYEVAPAGGGPARRVSGLASGDWYMRAFLRNASLRPSCLACPFKRRCGSDATLGDYWGIQSQHPEVSAGGGVSAVLLNTPRGEAAFARTSGAADFGESAFGKVAAGNPALVRSVAPHPDREAFMAALAGDAPISEMMRRWSFEPTLGQRLISKAKGAAKRLLGRA